MSTTLLSSAYLPPVSYFTLLYRSEKCTIERYCHYTKQTYRNRCHISGANGILPLSIPIVKPDTPKCHTCDIRISDHGEWRHLHWNAIVSAYGSSPFFEYYADELHPFYEKKYEFLFDYNCELTQWLCRSFGFEPEIGYTDQYRMQPDEDETDFREEIHPKKIFAERHPEIALPEYYQVFTQRHGFVRDLSAIDLLFNMGPESLFVLRG